MTKEDAQYEKMTQGNTKKLVLSLGTATMISMLITAIYNIADTFFVSDISKNNEGLYVLTTCKDPDCRFQGMAVILPTNKI